MVVDGAVVQGGAPAGTRGATFGWAGSTALVVAGDDGLVVAALDDAGAAAGIARGSRSRRDHRPPSEPRPLSWRRLAGVRGRAAAPDVSPDGLVAYVDETDDACVIAVAPLDGSRAPRIVSRADFAWDPAWSPDGRLLAWHEWDIPAMPWDGSRIVVAADDGADATVAAGGSGEAVGQPRFAPSVVGAVGAALRLAFVSDRDGWMNVTIAHADGRERVALAAEPHEHAEPSWGPGQRSFAWSPDGARIAWCRNEQGFGRLVVAALTGEALDEWSKGWHHGLDWGPGGLVGVRSGARTPPAVVVLANDGSARRVVEPAAGAEIVPAGELVEPRPVRWTSGDGADVHGLLFAPPRTGPHRAPPPLLVHLHGGPTDQTRVEWAPRLQHWVARGWAVLAPNPRGSTGYGRGYAQALNGRWGVRDVDDVIAGLDAAIRSGWGDPDRIALVGGSAGGYLALLVAARVPDRVRAVAVSYPVTDLLALAGATHRFERHSLATLVGPFPGATRDLVDRSPQRHGAAIRAPLLVLQGDADPVVPIDAVAGFVSAVRAAGGDVRYHVYPGEGHGWKRPETAVDALRRTDEFLTEVLGAPREGRTGGRLRG